MSDVTPINARRLDTDQMDAEPMLYLSGLTIVALEAVAELKVAIADEDKAVARAACNRLTSIGALAGIVGAKL